MSVLDLPLTWRSVLLITIIMITASLSSKNVSTETGLEKNVCWWVRNPHLTIAQHLACFFQLVTLVLVLLMEWSPAVHKFPLASLLCLAVLLVERNTTMSQRSRVGNPSIRNPVSRKMISDSAELRDSSLLLAHPTDKNECSTSRNTQDTPEVDFESSRSPAKCES